MPSRRLRFTRFVWSIEIRTGDSPFRLSRRDERVRNPVLSASDVTDFDAQFVADPFLLRHEDAWYLYFEAYDKLSRKGVICLAESADGLSWRYARTVLREPFHLSYPYVFRHDGEFYMIPETAQAKEVRLYQATEFPHRWACVGKLLSGVYKDPSLFRHDGLWWMFTDTAQHRGGTLRLHCAESLTGPWREHPQSPLIVDNARIARPGGRVLQVDGRLYRITQDTHLLYGKELSAFEICDLTPTRYRERRVGNGPILKGGMTWLGRRLTHHLDALQTADGRWLAAVDGASRHWALRRDAPAGRPGLVADAAATPSSN